MNTPKTDAAVITPRPVVVTYGRSWQPEVVLAQFARQLETVFKEMDITEEYIAQEAYKQADAMLKERNK